MANSSNKQSKNQQAAVARRAARKKAERKRNIIALAVIVAVMALLAGLLAGQGGTETAGNDSTVDTTDSTALAEVAGTPPTAAPVPGETITGSTPCPPADGAAQRVTQFEQAPPTCIDPAKEYTAVFDTNQGRIVVDLNDERSPIAVNNFVVLTRYGYYDGTAIFRTDPSIDIIQGGSPNTQTNQDGPGYSIQDDPGGFTYQEGQLIMARTGAPNSGGSQFFFSTGPNVQLLNDQGSYVTLGNVTEGLDILKQIIATHVDTGGQLGGAPGELVVLEDVTINER